MEFTREQLEAIARNAVGDEQNDWVSQLPNGDEFEFKVSDLAREALWQFVCADAIGRQVAALEQRLDGAQGSINALAIEHTTLRARLSSAEAERDILQWASDNAGSGHVNETPLDMDWKGLADAAEARASWSVDTHLKTGGIVSEIRLTVPGFADDELRRRVLAAVRKPDPIRLAESAYRETEAELREAGERVVSEDNRDGLPKGRNTINFVLPTGPERPHEALVWAQFLAAQIPTPPMPMRINEALVMADMLLPYWRARWPEPKA